MGDDHAVRGAENVSDKTMKSENSWILHSNSNVSKSDNPHHDNPPTARSSDITPIPALSSDINPIPTR